MGKSDSNAEQTPQFESWGRYPQFRADVVPLHWATDFPLKPSPATPQLPVGLGRSYGDVCLLENGLLLQTAGMDRLLHFDATTGMLRCEAGVSLQQILDFAVPRGFFLPVTPGTKYVTVGGAIANDIHGKNHHVAGPLAGMFCASSWCAPTVPASYAAPLKILSGSPLRSAAWDLRA